MSEKIYVMHNEEKHGPFSRAQLDILLISGDIAPDDSAFLVGDSEWRYVRDLRRQHDEAASGRDDLPAGQVVGIFLLLAAICAVIYALCIDVSVPVAGVGRVNNLGLMSDRQTFLILGCVGALIATMLIIFCRRPAK